jgi:hypothetical protein
MLIYKFFNIKYKDSDSFNKDLFLPSNILHTVIDNIEYFNPDYQSHEMIFNKTGAYPISFEYEILQ